MKKNWLKVTALILACAFALSTQAFAADRTRTQSRAQARTQDQTYDKIQDQDRDRDRDRDQDRLRDGSCQDDGTDVTDY